VIFVRFTNPDDFAEELRAEAGRIEDKVVRMVCSRRAVPGHTALRVVATALVVGRIIRLDRECGEFMFPDSEESRKVVAETNAVAQMIRTVATGLGLEVRTGVYEAA
jgi:hypothetical protein